MSNATHTIVDLFGGMSGFAKAIGRTPSTVQYWIAQGRIPEKSRNEVAKALADTFDGTIADRVVDLAVSGQ